MEIPPEVLHLITRIGSVFYFTDDVLSSPEPHYFIVVHVASDDSGDIILLCASSQVPKVKRRRRLCPGETLVEITTLDYSGFTVDSIIDCNTVFERTITDLIRKYGDGKLKLKPDMPERVVVQLRHGITRSPLVERRIKKFFTFDE